MLSDNYMHGQASLQDKGYTPFCVFEHHLGSKQINNRMTRRSGTSVIVAVSLMLILEPVNVSGKLKYLGVWLNTLAHLHDRVGSQN